MSQWLINAEGWQFSHVPLMNKIYSIYVVNESWATFHGSAGQKIRQMNQTQPSNRSCEIPGAIDIWDIWCQFIGALSQNHQQHFQKQVCDAPRDQLANPGLSFCLPRSRPRKRGEWWLCIQKWPCFWGWGMVGRANGNNISRFILSITSKGSQTLHLLGIISFSYAGIKADILGGGIWGGADETQKQGWELFQGRGDRQIGGFLAGSSQVVSG